MPLESWLPDIVRRHPERMELRYRSGGRMLPGSLLGERLHEALHATGLEWLQADDGSWIITLTWRTLVLGVIRRRLSERVEVRLVTGTEGQEVAVSCRPDKTHDAHAAGMSCVIVLAFLAWLVGGWSSTGLPSGIVTLGVGATLADYTRRASLTVLKRRLQRLAEDLGLALWPQP